MYKVDVYVNGERLDLFDNETISVVSSVQNINDISRNFNDFSQSFSVPASPRNNKILKHFYNAYINNGFDARVRHDAAIFVQTLLFRFGSIRLESCEIENNKPKSYKLTFFGLLVSLKEKIGDDFLTSLDLSKYDQTYSSENILTGLTTGFFSEDYIVPLISTQRQWFYNSNITSTTFTDTLSNIAWNNSAGAHGISWNELRPALKVIRIIEAIESRYGIAFSRDFLSTPAITNLYIWLANQDTEESLKTTYRIKNYEAINLKRPEFGSFNNSTGTFTPDSVKRVDIRKIYAKTFSNDNVFYTVQIMDGSNVLKEESGTGNLDFNVSVNDGLRLGAEIYLNIIVSAQKTITQINFRVEKGESTDVILANINTNRVIEGAQAQTFNFVPNIKILDFLKSMINMFNLVVIPKEDNNFDLKTLDSWYNEGEIIDVTKHIDTSGVTVNRSKIFREISFKFQEPQTILADAFSRTHNIIYGNLSTKLKNLDGTPLDGEEFEIELDFEQMLYERLFNLQSELPTNIVYGLSVDKGLSSTTPGPHLFYALKKSVATNEIGFVNQFSAKEQISGSVFMPSHANNLTNDYSTTFGSEINEHNGELITNSLFRKFYEDYITDSFNQKRRQYDYSARLPAHLISTIKLNDRLVILGKRFIINQMTSNITTGEVKFELLNDIFGDIANIVVEEQTPPPPPPPPLTQKSFSISNVGSASPENSCGFLPNTSKYWIDTTEEHPTLGDGIYNEIGLTTRFNGQSLYYKISGDLSLQINQQGIVTDVYTCRGAGGSQ